MNTLVKIILLFMDETFECRRRGEGARGVGRRGRVVGVRGNRVKEVKVIWDVIKLSSYDDLVFYLVRSRASSRFLVRITCK